MKEASAAFDHNTALFASIALKALQKKDTKESPLSPVQTKEKGVQISQVVPVIVAGASSRLLRGLLIPICSLVCLAHFLLVTFGFTGNRGYEKLLALEQWLTTFWQSADV